MARNIPSMEHERTGRGPLILDMTPEGEFRSPPVPPRRGWLDRVLGRVGGVALLLAVAAGGLLVVSLALLFIGLLLPVVIGAALVAVASLWWRGRRQRRDGGGIRFVVIRR